MDRSECHAVALQWANQGVAKGNVDVFDRLLAPGAIDHSGPAPARGSDSFKDRTRALHAALSEIEVVVEDLLVDGDRMAWRWTLVARHVGPLLGAAPTGRRVTLTGVNIQRISDGRIVEHWSYSDPIGLLRKMQAPEA